MESVEGRMSVSLSSRLDDLLGAWLTRSPLFAADIFEIEEPKEGEVAAPAQPAPAAVPADKPADAMDVDSEIAPAPEVTVAAPQGDATKYSLMFRCTKYVVLYLVHTVTIANLLASQVQAPRSLRLPRASHR